MEENHFENWEGGLYLQLNIKSGELYDQWVYIVRLIVPDNGEC